MCIMKKIILFVSCTFFIAISFSQEIPRKNLEDSMIGWIKIYHFKGFKEPMKVDHRNYSVAQLSLIDSFANWMQASYIPKGGLGDIKKIISEKLGPYNQHTAGLPQHYGAYARTYYFLKYDSKGKLVPATSHDVTWSIIANGVPSDWGIRDLCTPTQSYFTMPSYEAAHDGDALRKMYDLTNVTNIAPYTKLWVRSIETGGGSNFVLLSKDNRSPFIKLTKGEFLKIVEAALPLVYEREKKKLIDREQGDVKRASPFVKYLDELYEKRKQNLAKTKEKYKNRLDEIALVNAQPSLFDLETGRDLFSSGYLTDTESTKDRTPVYKIDPEMAGLCKTDKPQWILVGWWWSLNDPLEKHLHESIIYNFNFSYLYNFFYDPSKIKGQPYRPLRDPAFREAVVINESSETSKKNNADKNIYYFEDFSTTEIGKKPVGWRSDLGYNGKTSTVVQVDGLEGKWATGNYELSSLGLKKPLPQDFTLSYELVASQNFTWGAKGLTLRLFKEASGSNQDSWLKIKLRPGFDGREGETTIEGKFSAGYLSNTRWATAPGFSNNKKNNHITVTIKKNGERLLVFVDDNKVADYEKAIPASTLFNGLTFEETGNDGDKDKYYIGNIKIVKE